ncbi:hypothetical protein SD80_006415 [Scytonema tolypothrichoides VB-61278]|nr:hypothetical protein SD80_006415 [Scytonema tolypothrichoides VB-61278]
MRQKSGANALAIVAENSPEAYARSGAKGHAALNAIDLCYRRIATWYEQVLFQTAVECHGQRLQPVTNERNTFPTHSLKSISWE